jgi:hypothetical protein
MLARRATPMYLVEDLSEARSRYEALGFEPKITDDSGCTAGPTNVILLNREYAERTMPARAVELLEQKPALYIWVESLDAMRALFSGAILGEVKMAGLREWAVESDQGLMVLAETARPH